MAPLFTPSYLKWGAAGQLGSGEGGSISGGETALKGEELAVACFEVEVYGVGRPSTERLDLLFREPLVGRVLGGPFAKTVAF